VPEAGQKAVTSRFVCLKRRWGVTTPEIKGSKLDEIQMEEAIDLLIGCGCLFFVVATEMSVNDESAVKVYQRDQADEFTRRLTDDAHPELRTQLTGIQATFGQMAPQLFIQAVLLTDLVKKIIDVATLHFAMTSPKEAGAFQWVIDRKDVTKTKYEAAWELIAGGVIQGRYLDSSGAMAMEGDYSHFERFFTEDQKWPAYMPPPRSRYPHRRGKILNLSKILGESFTFADSAATPGLQLADIVTNGFRRAMMGRLHPKAYCRMGKLMVRASASPFELHCFSDAAIRPEINEYSEPHSIIKTRSRFAGTAT